MRLQTFCPCSRLVQRPDYLWSNVSAGPCVWISVGSYRETVKNWHSCDIFLKATLPENARHISDVNSNVVLRMGD